MKADDSVVYIAISIVVVLFVGAVFLCKRQNMYSYDGGQAQELGEA